MPYYSQSYYDQKTIGLLCKIVYKKSPIVDPTFMGTVNGITKTMVGLSNVDNTSDLNKPISVATQIALDTKAPLLNPTFVGTVNGITKTMVGLSNVDNTSDLNKPISINTQIALDTKAPLLNPTFMGTVNGITKTMVGLSNVDNTSDLNKPISTNTQIALDTKAPLLNPTFLGVVNGITKSMVGLPDVDNTSDINKPISTNTQIALDTKAPLLNPNFLGVVKGVTKSMVGLPDVDNTSDINKPISIATQTALNAKAPLLNPSFTGTLTYSTLGNVVAITNGGTGSSTRQGAINALTGSSTNKYYLRGDGSNTIMSPLLFTDLIGVINVYNLFDVTLSETHSNSLVITEHTGSPYIPEDLPNGFTCTLFNYSIFSWTSNILTTTKFYTSTSGATGVFSITIPACGAITLFVAVTNGVTYYIVK
jgi:hypothetical protein